MAVDISGQMITGLRALKFGFAIQLDEPTDVTNCCQLLVYLQSTKNAAIETKILLNHEVPATLYKKRKEC